MTQLELVHCDEDSVCLGEVQCWMQSMPAIPRPFFLARFRRHVSVDGAARSLFWQCVAVCCVLPGKRPIHHCQLRFHVLLSMEAVKMPTIANESTVWRSTGVWMEGCVCLFGTFFQLYMAHIAIAILAVQACC